MKENRSISYISRFELVKSFMEDSLEKWNSIEEIRRTYDEFTHNLKKIKDLQPELEQDLSPVKKELDEKRELLLKRLFPIGNILEVYAEDHKIGKKAAKLLVSKKELKSTGNKDLLEYSRKLHKLIDKIMHRVEFSGQDIRRYGLNQAMMDDLHAAGHQFESAIQLQKDLVLYQSRILKKRDKLISTNRKLLKNRLNKLMTVFSGTHPAYYTEYTELAK